MLDSRYIDLMKRSTWDGPPLTSAEQKTLCAREVDVAIGAANLPKPGELLEWKINSPLRDYYPHSAYDDNGNTRRTRSQGNVHSQRERILWSSGQDTIQLTLIEPIKAGYVHHTQVWECEAEGRTLFLKLYYGDPTLGTGGDYLEPAIAPEEYYESEARGYDHLWTLQGTIVPHCYGFYNFSLRFGHVCVGTVLERIQGIDIVDYFLSRRFQLPKDKEQVIGLLQRLLKSYFEIRNHGVIHCDIQGPNLIITNPKEKDVQKLQIVFIDFDCSYLISDDVEKNRRVALFEELADFSELFSSCHRDMLQCYGDWLKKDPEGRIQHARLLFMDPDDPKLDSY